MSNAGELVKFTLSTCTLTQDEKETLATFDKFSTYLTEFTANTRAPKFEKAEVGSIAYRIINENFDIYRKNIYTINYIKSKLLIDNAEKDEILALFTQIDHVDNFNHHINQQGINQYNQILGAIKTEDEHIQGLNEKLNLYSQKYKIKKLPKLKQLYKMPLIKSDSASFKFDIIDDDLQLLEQIKSVITDFESTNLPTDLALNNHVYLNGKPETVTFLSSKLFKNYNEINARLFELESASYNKINEKAEDKINKKIANTPFYQIKEIEQVINPFELQDKEYKSIIDFFNQHFKDINKHINEKLNDFKNHSFTDNIKNSNKDKLVIQSLLDAFIQLRRFFKNFYLPDDITDEVIDFYNIYINFTDVLARPFNHIYNKARNYLTKKPFKQDKFKLVFENAQLAGGWTKTKEADYSTIILKKGRLFYLGIWDKKNATKKDIDTLRNSKNSHDLNQYQKFELEFAPKAISNFKRIFINGKKYKEKLTQDFIKRYEQKAFNDDPAFLIDVINYFKDCLKHYDNGTYKYQDAFNYQFKDAKDYQTLYQFFDDVDKQSCKATFIYISDKKIDELIEREKLYLFQIYSKDFSEHSKGTKNLNTIYFESVFSDENLKKTFFRLQGEAEIFYRPKSISYEQSKMQRGHHYDKLKDKFAYPIIKDKRYTQNKLFFHVPVEINFKSENLSNINDEVHKHIHQFKHIIGIDRGERHLVYISVIDLNGNIVEQKSLNEIINIDTKNNQHKSNYMDKLTEKAKQRDTARKSWDDIENIKELKEGYISHIVNEIRTMQEKYHALIVLENLEYGFKQSRIKIEKQVYQKFELALIQKFNYVIDKKDSKTHLHGKQLTNKVTTLNDIKSQNGIIFYIPAWNTSKIDPTTGFVNLFYANSGINYKNIDDAKAFIAKFNRISYNEHKNYFEFDIDYKNFINHFNLGKSKWTLNTYGTRINTFRDKNQHHYWISKEVNLTQEFINLFQKFGLDYQNINSDEILIIDKKEFYESFLRLFKLTLQMRNSITNDLTDYMISPVQNKNGLNFDSQKSNHNLPNNADANGAYNIARKGLMVVENIKNSVKDYTKINKEDYLKFVQNN